MADELTNLKRLLVTAESEEKAAAAERDRAEAEFQRAREKADLLRRLVGLSQGTDVPAVRAESTPKGKAASGTTGDASTMEDHVEQMLRSANEPVHISKIRQALVDAGVPLPGRGDEANIIVRLARDTGRFVRTGRGTYGLVALGATEVRPTRIKKVSRARGDR